MTSTTSASSRGRGRFAGAGRVPPNAPGQDRSVAGAETELRGACGRARSLRTPSAGDRNERGREVEQPGQRNLGRRRTSRLGDVDQRLAAGETAGSARAPERGVCDHGDPGLGAAFDDSSPEGAVVVGAERDLDSADWCELERLLQLAAVDVCEPDARHEAFVGESGQGAHGRTPRRPRIGRVDEVEVDRQAVQGGEARLAVGAQRLRATVRDPAAVGPRHAALRHDPRGLVGAACA
jgi:hypothetical protein